MKLSINTDFTSLPRAGVIRHAGEGGAATPSGRVVLAHDEREMRRKVLTLESGDKVLVDLLEPVALASGDLLVLDDGGMVEITAADEEILEIRARDEAHLAELAWHLGNRHLAVEIAADRIAVLRDPDVKAMLEARGAAVTEATGPFFPLRGTGHGHGHGHHHDRGEPDRYGRFPGDPHYGHNHA